MSKIRKACLGYASWKAKHQPQLKPWLYPEQLTLPRLDLKDIQSMKEQLEAAAADETSLKEDEFDDTDDNLMVEAANGMNGGGR
jgi:hypothetical protein